MIEQVFDAISTQHMEFRFGKWWECIQPTCDGVHHYYIETSQP